jgi:hypothetical protein
MKRKTVQRYVRTLVLVVVPTLHFEWVIDGTMEVLFLESVCGRQCVILQFPSDAL